MQRMARVSFVLIAVSIVTALLVGQAGSRAAPTRSPKRASTAPAIARLKPPKPFHEMTLLQTERFQKRALAVYSMRWQLWRAHRAWLLEAGVQLKTCRGARAPNWACWYLEASIWTRKELAQTRGHIKAKRLLAMGVNDWGTAVRYVQRVFPGTEAWLLSCSGSEGGHGLWKPYHAYGSSYYAGYEYTDSVGGWLQFRPSTFRVYFATAVHYARAHGLRVPLNPADWLKGWLSPLGQAVTGGYMRAVAKNSHWHWLASIDRGCA